jgi:hypothetical protein
MITENEFNIHSASGPLYAAVATTRALLLVELKSKSVTPIEWNRPEYYGITWRPNAHDLILTHSMLDNNELTDIVSYAQSEVGIISEGEFTSQPFLSQPHQIIFSSDGRIICTNTGRNSISIYDPAKPTLMQEVRIPDSARWDRLSAEYAPGDHLNSVFEKNNVLYAIAHRHTKGSALMTFTLPDLELVSREPIRNRTGIHNIWVTDEGQRIACHSDAGALIDLNSDSAVWESGSKIYTRGLAASADFVLVGESQLAGRASRRHSLSGLWLLDRKTWRALDYFCLGSYGAVHEVRLLNVVDQAHHGHLFAGIETLLKRDQREVIAAERLATCERVQLMRRSWAEFHLTCGSPAPGGTHGAHGSNGQAARPDDLCMLIQRPESRSKNELDFSYSLDQPAGQSHVAVIAYRGQGGDTDMDALLIQRVGETEATIGRWNHDGQSWTGFAETTIANIPVSGKIHFTRTPDGVALSIDDRPILGNLLDGFSVNSDALGIRWLGSTIYPPGA